MHHNYTEQERFPYRFKYSDSILPDKCSKRCKYIQRQKPAHHLDHMDYNLVSLIQEALHHRNLAAQDEHGYTYDHSHEHQLQDVAVHKRTYRIRRNNIQKHIKYGLPLGGTGGGSECKSMERDEGKNCYSAGYIVGNQEPSDHIFTYLAEIRQVAYSDNTRQQRHEYNKAGKGGKHIHKDF